MDCNFGNGRTHQFASWPVSQSVSPPQRVLLPSVRCLSSWESLTNLNFSNRQLVGALIVKAAEAEQKTTPTTTATQGGIPGLTSLPRTVRSYTRKTRQVVWKIDSPFSARVNSNSACDKGVSL